MVNIGKSKYKKFKTLKVLNNEIRKYGKNASETEAYLRAVKKDIREMKKGRKDLFGGKVLDIKISLNPLK